MTISQETRYLARGLYVRDRFTFEEVSDRMGVPVGTLKNWSKEEDWPGRRHTLLRENLDAKEQLQELRRKLILQAVSTLDPQKIWPALKLEGMLNPATEIKEAQVDRPRIFLEDLDFVAGVLKEINPEGLKVLAGSFGIIVERFKERHAQAA